MTTQRRTQSRYPAGRRPHLAGSENDTRSAVLAAARSVFARKGFDGASTRDVAQLAGVNNAMIYYHFKDKDQLYRAVLVDSFAPFERIWDHRVFRSSATVRQKIRKFIEEFIRFQERNEDLRKIMSMEFAVCSPHYRWLADNYFVHSHTRLTDLLKEGIKRGELRRCDPVMVIPSLVGMIIHSFIMRPISEHVCGRSIDLTASRFGKFVTDVFFDGLHPAVRKKTSQGRSL